MFDIIPNITENNIRKIYKDVYTNRNPNKDEFDYWELNLYYLEGLIQQPHYNNLPKLGKKDFKKLIDKYKKEFK